MQLNKILVSLVGACCVLLSACSKNPSTEVNSELATTELAQVPAEATFKAQLDDKYIGKYQKLVNVLGNWQELAQSELVIAKDAIVVDQEQIDLTGWQVEGNTIMATNPQGKVVLSWQLQDDIWLDRQSNGLYAYRAIK